MEGRRLATAVLAALCVAVSAKRSPAQDRAGGPVTAVTIDQAVREALDRNVGLLAAKYDIGVADAAVLTASLKPNPVVTLNFMRADQGLIAAGVSPNEEVIRTDYVFERGGKLERRVDQARLAKSMAELQVLNAARTLVFDVEDACTSVQVARLNLALAQDNLTAFRQLVQVNTERVRTGDLSQGELSRSRLALLQFQNDVRQQESKLRVARSRLSTLLGRGPDGDALDVTGDLRRDSGTLDYEALRVRALAARPDLLAARTDQARSVADLRLQLANGTVDYTISGEFHRQQGDFVRGNTFGVFFSAPLPIFNRNQGEIARAKVQRQQLDARVRALEQDISNEMATAFDEYTTSRDIVETIETQMLTQARDVRASTEYAYRSGEASFVEFLDAVRAFNDTMQSYNDARAAYARSLYQLDAISGKGAP